MPTGPAEDDVLGHGHGPDQREVLGDHADACRDGVTWRADGHGSAIHPDVAAVGHRQAVQDAHQGRLAGPVLTQECVDLAAGQVEIDRIVGDEVPEPLA